LNPKIEPLWPNDEELPTDRHGHLFRLENGQQYLLTGTLLAIRSDLSQNHRVAVTRYILDHPEENPVVIHSDNIEAILNRPALPLNYRIRLLKLSLIDWFDGKPGRKSLSLSPHVPDYVKFLVTCGFDIDGELQAALDYLHFQGFIEIAAQLDGEVQIKLGIVGILEVESDHEISHSKTVFVAMWFNPELSSVYDEAIAPAIEDHGFTAVRIDRTEYNDKIDDQIIAEIRRCHYLVADFSCGEDGARGGVYYEAGFASGLGKQVIYCVREADLERVHFDTRQMNHIVWADAENLKMRLSARIGATIGDYKTKN